MLSRIFSVDKVNKEFETECNLNSYVTLQTEDKEEEAKMS